MSIFAPKIDVYVCYILLAEALVTYIIFTIGESGWLSKQSRK